MEKMQFFKKQTKERVSASCGNRLRTTRFHRAMTVALLALTALGAKATDYVFVYDGNNYLSNNNGTIANSTSFVPNTCIWTCYNGTTETTLGNTSYSLKNGNRYLNSDDNRGTSVSLSNTEVKRWRLNSSYLTHVNSQTSYLYYRDNTWKTSRSAGGGTNYGADRYTGRDGSPDYRATVYTVTTESLTGGYTDFTISGDEYITATGTKNYSHTNTVNQTACTTYTFNDLTYYSTDNSKAATTTKPGTEVTTGYTWSLSGANGYATVNNTGAITVNSIPDEDVVMTLTCTVNGKSATKQVTLTKVAPVAAGYVIYSGGANGNYLTTSTNGTTSFDPTTCLWQGTSGSTLSNGGYYVYLGNSATISANARNVIFEGTESGETGMKIKRSDNNNWLRYDGSWTRTGTSTSSGTNVLFAVIKKATAEVSTAPTITTSDATFTATGSSKTYVHSVAAYTMGYNDYIFYNGAHHYWKSDDSEAITGNTQPTAETFTYTWSLSDNAAGHATVSASTGEVSYGTYFSDDTEVTLTLTATSANKTFTVDKTLTFEAPKTDPTGITATIDKSTIYVSETGQVSYTLQGTPCYDNVTFSSSNTSVATVNANTGVVTAVGVGTATITATAHHYTAEGTDKTAMVSITVKNKVATPVFSFKPTLTDEGETATATITCATEGATISYSTDGGTTWTAYTTGFTVNNLDEVKAKAVKSGDYWDDSDVATATYSKQKVPTPTINFNGGSVTFSCEEPDVTFYYIIGASPADPTAATGTEWEEGDAAITGITNEQFVKVIATKSGFSPSVVTSRQYIASSGISGGTVILNDYEDHNWTYYSDPESPIKSLYPRNVKITYYGNGTNTVSTSDDANPAANTFTASTNNAVAVSMYESENTFVYYKTLERYVPINNLVEGTPQNIYPYDLIPNPFSKRPTYGTNADTKWRGFYGWRVKSVSGGKIYSNVNRTGEITTGTILTTEYQKLYFLPNDAGETNANNATSMTVEFEAIWARAYRVVSNANAVNTNISSGTFQNVSYERNFLVINAGTTGNTNISNTSQKPATVMMVEPDGSSDYRAATRYINPAYVIAQNNLKFEWMNMQVSNTLSANAKNLVVGRGVLPAGASGSYTDAPLGNMSATGTNPNPTVTANRVNGLGSTTSDTNSDYSTSVNFYLRLESGVYGTIYYVSGNGGSRGRMSGSATCHVTGFFGNDYDRAKNNNDRMVTKVAVLEGTSNGFNNTSSRYLETMHLTMKSGIIGTNYNKEIAGGTYAPGPTNACYIAVGSNATACGMRRFIVEGGSISCITGGMETWEDSYTENIKNNLMTDIRVKYNSIVRSAAFGGPANAEHFGLRRMVYTGGQVFGWVAGACNGNSDNGGQLRGATQVYVGGNAIIGDKNKTADNQITVNGSKGGNVFGAGRGRASSTTTGEVTYGTTVVVADDAYIVSNVYGGGDLGYALTTANVHVLGGEVMGGVFGGANAKQGETVNIVMRGGLVHGGVYGGSNSTGTISGNVTMQINGGQVGTSGQNANIHGGGYGQPTVVSGNVDIKLGADGAERDSEGVVVYGDVYGGSALGSVNGTTATTTYHTNVTMNAGYIHGSIYGGALGSNDVAANVYGPVAVTVNGGSVYDGAVFGCNNINGSPQRDVTVTINGTNMPESGYALNGVYGGGNLSDYVPVNGVTGYPKVYVNGCENSIKDLYGGGNAASVPNTNVEVQGGLIGRLFAGGNGESGTAAHVGYRSNGTTTYGTGNTYAKIMGGEIHQIFGGSNSMGTIRGTITLDVDKDDYCDVFRLGEIYGGGNEAPSKAGTINIGCTGTYTPASEGVEENGYISAIYGGANAADITGDIDLKIRGGHIGTIFGGNNASGSISGDISITVDKTIDGVAGTCNEFNIGTIFSGGNEADFDNTTQVNVTGADAKTIGKIYGGGNLASVGSTSVTVKGGTVGTIFGGGKGTTGSEKEMIQSGGTNVNVYGGTITDIFGGNDAGGTITGDLEVVIDKTQGDDSEALSITGDVYGGGNQASSAAGSIDIVCANDIANVFGGAKNADVIGNIELNVGSGQIQNIYGGNNLGGTAGGNITVNVTKVTGDCGTSFTVDNVFGGGYGADTQTGGNVTVNIGNTTEGAATDVTISGDVYGGSALGAVNAASTNTTTVNLYGGTLSGNVYGGGLGQLAAAATETKPAKEKILAIVKGSTAVNVYAGTTFVPAKDSDNKYTYTTGMVFGCNNMAGAPAGTATVTVNGTSSLLSVYGGGNLAEYTGNPTVNVLNGTLAGNVFGGGLGASAVVVGNPTVNVGDWIESHSVVIGGDVFGGGDLAAVEGAPTVTIRDCGTLINGNLYGGGNAAPVYSTNTTMWGGTVKGNVFGGGNGSDASKNAKGAQVGYKRDDTETAGTGNAVTNIFGGTVGTWSGTPAACAPNTGGVFGGSNTTGNIVGKVVLTVDERECEETEANKAIFGEGELCTPLLLKEAYGAGNEAAYLGSGIEFNLGCVTSMGEIYGGAKAADLDSDVDLKITSGHFDKVFGGNNVSGKLNGSITVTVDETGCNPVTIGELYGGGNMAPYSIYGYNDDGTVKTSGTKLYDDPVVNIVSCTSIGTVYGGGYGTSATVVGNPTVNINQIPGIYASAIDANGDSTADNDENAIGTIGNIFGGGNAAPVQGNTFVNIGTAKGTQKHVTGTEAVKATEYAESSANISGNVYGGGNKAKVTGNTKVVIGPEKTAEP